MSKGGERVLLFVANLSPVPRGPYRLGLPRPGRWVEAINTDSTYYGGTDTGNFGGVEAEPIPWHNQAFSAEITLPPLGAIWLVPEEKPEVKLQEAVTLGVDGAGAGAVGEVEA